MKTEWTRIAFFAALIAIGAWISVPLGYASVTLQTLFVMLAGVVLGERQGTLAVLLYILIGFLGLPVFAGGVGGIGIIAKPSFGFIMGFLTMPIIIGRISPLGERSVGRLAFSFLMATVILYVFGLSYMSYILNQINGMGLSVVEIFRMGALIYLPGDFIKIFVAISVARRLAILLPKQAKES